MKQSIETTLFQLLKQLEVNVSFTYIKEELNSHPDFPSLLSITDTLQNLGVDNLALAIDKDKISEVPDPFIIHTSGSNGNFLLIKNKEKFFKKHPGIIKEWDGVVLAAEKPLTALNKENAEMLKKEKQRRNKIITGVAAILLLSALALLNSFSISNLLLLTLCLTGIAVSILIIQHEMGYANSFTDQLCSIGKQTDCDAVLNSKASKLPLALQWSDVGITYFSAVWLVLMIEFITAGVGAAKTVLAITAALAIPFTLFSIYYQWRVVKKWCMLCLLTVGILWLQFAVLFPQLSQPQLQQIPWYGIINVAGSAVLMITIWLALARPFLNKQKEYDEKIMPLLRFKRNPDVLLTMLEKQPRTDVTPIEHELQLGNPNAPMQVMVACNPYCNPCAEAHAVLDELMERHKEEVGLSIRFVVSPKHKEDKRTMTVEYMLQHVYTKTNGFNQEEKSRYYRQVLHDWYHKMDFAQFKTKYELAEPVDVDNTLTQYGQWSEKSNIRHTPSFFINGYELPPGYTINDLPLFINILKQSHRESLAINKPTHAYEEVR